MIVQRLKRGRRVLFSHSDKGVCIWVRFILDVIPPLYYLGVAVALRAFCGHNTS